jgi:phosphonate transport system substrate-binding protein
MPAQWPQRTVSDHHNFAFILSTESASLFPIGKYKERLMLRRTPIPSLLIGASLLFATSFASAETPSIKIVVTAAMTSLKGMPVYDEMARYVARKLAWNVKVVSNLSYAEADNMLDKGIIQVGFVCGLPYVQKVAEGKYGLVAIPIMSMKKGAFPDAKGYDGIPGKYYSYTIVRKDSPLKTWADLKGKSYAFSDIGSNSGYNLPRARLVSLGAKDWTYFSNVIVSGSHEESIRLVASGAVDASSVDSLVLDFDRMAKDAAALNVRIIEHLGPAGIPPVVVSKMADPSIRQAMMEVLLAMHHDPEGRNILDKAMVTRFDPPDDRNYDDIRAYRKTAKDAGFVDYKQ